MDQPTTHQQLWIFVKETDQAHGRPLFLAILDLLRQGGIAGATALHGVAGYGTHGRLHTATLVELGADMPIVITCVDRADRIARLLPDLVALAPNALISATPAQLLHAGQRDAGPFPAHLTVSDVMSRDVAQAHPDTPVSEIVVLLIDRALRALPVTEQDGHVVGIITDGDLLARSGMDLSLGLQRALPPPERAAGVAPLAQQPHQAADVMTREVITLAADTPLAQAAATMAERHLKRLPVVDTGGRLVGMVSRSDLLKTVSESLRQRPPEAFQLAASVPATAKEIMLRDVPTVHRDTPLAEALDRLLETEKRRVVVVDDDRRVVGIITDGDLIGRAARRARPGALQALVRWLGGGKRPDELEVTTRGRTAADVMTSPVVTVQADTPIAEAASLMIARRVKRLPVIDADGRLIGLLGRAGVLAALSHAAA